MGAFSPVEQDALAKSLFTALCTREHYAAADEPGKWITIGGGSGPGGEKHAGGTPVKLGPGGEIEAGPKQLEGKPIAAVDQNKEASDRPAWHGLKEEAEAAEKAGNLEKAARRWNDAAANHPGGQSHPEAQELVRRAQQTASGKPSLNLRPTSVEPLPAQTPPAVATPAENPQGPPNVSAEQHAQVKAAVGTEALVAYYRNGAYHFLHDDAPKASGVLGSTSVPHGDLQGALNKLVAAGHRVAVAEPNDQKPPRQKPTRPKTETLPNPEPARPLIGDSPPARQGESHQQAPQQPGAIPPGQPAGEPPLANAKPAPSVADKPSVKKSQDATMPQTPPASPATAAAGEPSKGKKPEGDAATPPKPATEGEPLSLTPPKSKPATTKTFQATLFDKLADIGVGSDKPSTGKEASKPKEEPAAEPPLGGHRLKNSLGEKPPPGVKVLNNGQWSGSTQLHVNSIHTDPHRFQYKVSGIDEKTGVTKELKDTDKFNPDLAGQVLVWRDPADGKTYVINGHHRVELAKRSGGWEDEESGEGWHGEMQVRYINAANAKEARARGALANIAEGRGTATDAAKFMRDTGRSMEDLQRHGISQKGKIAADALALKDLSSQAFQDLAQERLPESRALAVAKNLKDADKQDWLFRRIANRERKGEPTPDSLAATMAKGLALSKPTQATGGGLFGDDFQEQTFDQRNELIDSLSRDLASEKNIFKSVSTARRVGKITAEGKNILDVEANRDKAQQAAEFLADFDREANSKGPVSDLLNAAAAELKNDRKRKPEILQRLKRDVLPVLKQQWAAATKRSGGEKDSDVSPGTRDSYSATAADAAGDSGAAEVGSHAGSVGSGAGGRGPAAARGGLRDRDGGFCERLTAAIESCLRQAG